MSTSRESSQVRNFSLLSLDNQGSAAQSTEDLRAGTTSAARPVPSNRERSPNPHSRTTSLDIRPARSAHNLRSGTASRDASPHTHSRLPSLTLGQPFNQSDMLISPAPNTARTVTPSYLSHYDSHYDRSPIMTPVGEPRSGRRQTRGGFSPEELVGEKLLPPPPIGGSFSERISSPTTSRDSSRARGRPDNISTGPDSRSGSPARPVTPTSGKLNKKKTWGFGKSHGRSASGPMPDQPWAFIVGTAGKQPYELSYLTKAQPVCRRNCMI